MENEEKKISTVEAIIRLILMFGPIIIPPIVASTRNGKAILPAFWLIFMMPLWLIPDPARQWEEGAKKFEWIFDSVGKIMFALFCISLAPYFLFYGPK